MQEIEAQKTWFDGHEFDSKLEAGWYVTLLSWGMHVEPHPGPVQLASGEVWEPDFLVADWTGVEVLCEAKGDHNHRLHKVVEADAENEGDVIVLRAGLVPAGSEVETAGAVWHAPVEWGVSWVVCFDRTGRGRFSKDGPREGETVRVSAEQTLIRPSTEGLEMRRA